MNHDKLASNSDFPLILLRLGWLTFIVVIIGGLALTLALSLGLADPSRAGTLQRDIAPFVIAAAPNAVVTKPDILILPRPSYTLEVIAALSPDAPDASWELAFTAQQSATDFAIRISDYGFYSMLPAQPDSIPFIHIRTDGKPNKITLDVDAVGTNSTLRINDEIAWQGNVPSVTRLTIIVRAGDHAAQLEVQSVKFYFTP